MSEQLANAARESAQRNYEAAYGSYVAESRSRFHVYDVDGERQAWTGDAAEAELFLRMFPGGRIVDRSPESAAEREAKAECVRRAAELRAAEVEQRVAVMAERPPCGG